MFIRLGARKCEFRDFSFHRFDKAQGCDGQADRRLGYS